MAIDPAKIELTVQQKELLAARAEREGKDYSAVLDEWLGVPTREAVNGESSTSVLEQMLAIGAVGCVKNAPSDLSINPKYMEGFGTNASRKHSST